MTQRTTKVLMMANFKLRVNMITPRNTQLMEMATVVKVLSRMIWSEVAVTQNGEVCQATQSFTRSSALELNLSMKASQCFMWSRAKVGDAVVGTSRKATCRRARSCPSSSN